jgi:hypothetical protein
MRAVQFRRFEQYEIELHDLTLVELKFCPVGPCFSAFDLAGSGWLAVSEVSDIRDHQQPYRQATEETRLVSLYSILPHKELRFIFPALPMLTLTAGAALDRLLPPDGGDILFPLSLFVGNREGSSAKSASKGFGKKAFVSLYRCDVIAL